MFGFDERMQPCSVPEGSPDVEAKTVEVEMYDYLPIYELWTGPKHCDTYSGEQLGTLSLLNELGFLADNGLYCWFNEAGHKFAESIEDFAAATTSLPFRITQTKPSGRIYLSGLTEEEYRQRMLLEFGPRITFHVMRVRRRTGVKQPMRSYSCTHE